MNYLKKSYQDIVTELSEIIKAEFPDSYRDFTNSNSYSFILLNLIAQATDMLNFYTDYNTRETYLSFAQERESLIDMASVYGYKINKNTCSQVVMSIKFTIPIVNYTSTPEISEYISGYDSDDGIDFTIDGVVLPVISSGMKVKTDDGSTQFISITPIYFTKPTKVVETEDGIEVYKDELFYSGEEVVIEHIITENKKYYTIEISDSDFAYIKEIKDTTDNKVWKEVDYLAQETILEVDYLAQETILDENTSSDDLKLEQKEMSDSSGTGYANRKFIVRMNSDENMNIIFGSGSEISETLNVTLTSGNSLSTIDKSGSCGIKPTNGNTFQITYIKSNGDNTNVASHSITKIESYTATDDDGLLDTMEIDNENASVFGASAESDEDLRTNILNHIYRQNRVVTKEDYISVVKKMPAKYGRINKVYVEKYKTDSKNGNNNDNTIAVYLDVENSNNSNVKDNVKNWLNFHRMATDNILITSPYTVSVGVSFSIYVFGGYNKEEKALECIETTKSFFDNLQINKPIIISQLYSELMMIEGIKSVNGIEFVNKYDDYKTQGYPKIKYDIEGATKNDNIIYPPTAISIFKIINYEDDIEVTV